MTDEPDSIPRRFSFISSTSEDQTNFSGRAGIVLNIDREKPASADEMLPTVFSIGAALVGLAAAPLWTAQANYLNQIARYHAQYKKQSDEISISLFCGIFFALFSTNIIWGNLISYFVLNQSSNLQKINCGVNFDPRWALPTNTTQNVDDTTVSVASSSFLR
ncbi:unnamed protein product [Rotaria sp. Silwood2]|nr:unnamed protein product [Rotaria sp. Silwood2]CAF3088229.1 unnamed protein product [Rotaria sp. Silwood2]CAF3299333.1 unnamed protein product [Rotaria sp. Silwood2]